MLTKINIILKSKTKINEGIYLFDKGITLLDTKKVASKFNGYVLYQCFPKPSQKSGKNK